MNEYIELILQKISETGSINENQISDELDIDLYEVRYYLDEMEKLELIEQIKGGNFATRGNAHHVLGLTPKGHMVARGKIPIDSNESLSRIIYNSNSSTENRNIQIGSGNYNERIERDYIQGNIYNNYSINISKETRKSISASISQEIPVIDDRQKILQALANFFKNNPNSCTGDSEISEALEINIHKVRVCFQELSKQGYIEVLDGADHTTEERSIVIRLTSKGWVFVDSQHQ
jgi:Mn-dependent DtxR family transcriptional regulator